jgi:hypothetical protein
MKARPKSGGWMATSSRRSGPLWPETGDADESAQAEEIDSLLLSSLRYWEVERDLIEERMAQLPCARTRFNRSI